MNILEVKNLRKEYPKVTAVDGVSFAAAQGACFGLLGPNGAGKTTTLEVVEGVAPPTSGEILYKGRPKTRQFRQEVGIQFQSTSLLAFLTVDEILKTFARLYKKPMDLGRLAAMCHLEDILDRPNDKISGGQKQRLLLALALVNDPDLVFLDEPTTGLDPQARRHVWDIVRSIKAQGKTLVLTTHYMEEAEKLCDRVAIMDHGRIIAEGGPAELPRRHGGGFVAVVPAASFPVPPASLAREGVKVLEKNGTVRIRAAEVRTCLDILTQAGVSLGELTIRSPNLEDLFLKLTGRRLRE